ncbi:integral membrane protein [Fusarium mexicanum]|uniref:Integral membrane protein n=1 Tax=Fusarium mexicanum TaxID=751941 RepID=A0A8H5JJB3_9HYPO|nr:integral membrane protein [Fusarium mexicanum]
MAQSRSQRTVLSHWRSKLKTIQYCGNISPTWLVDYCAADLDKQESYNQMASRRQRLGAGTSIKDVDRRGLYLLIENAKWAGILAYNLSTVFTKASVLMFYLRFTVDMHFIICAYAVLLVVVANCVFHTIAAIAVIDCVSDLILLLLPFWLLHPMKVPLSRKIGITLILMPGGFVLVVSIIRLVTTVKVDEDLDVASSLGYGLLWSILEPWSGVMYACLPCLKPLFTPAVDHRPTHKQGREYAIGSYVEARVDDPSNLIMKTKEKREKEFTQAAESLLVKIVQIEEQRKGLDPEAKETRESILENFRDRFGSIATDLQELKQNMRQEIELMSYEADTGNDPGNKHLLEKSTIHRLKLQSEDFIGRPVFLTRSPTFDSALFSVFPDLKILTVDVRCENSSEVATLVT